MDYKFLLSALGIAIALITYAIYFKDIVQGKTKPHAFSWFVWGVLELTSFGILLTSGGGTASWVNGCSGLLCLVVAMIGLKQKHQAYTKTDWVAFSLALVAIIFWQLANQPLLAVICLTTADSLGFIPTIRKSYSKPHEETISMFLLSAIKYGFIIAALETYSPTTLIYPVMVCVADSLLTLMLMIRQPAKPRNA